MCVRVNAPGDWRRSACCRSGRSGAPGRAGSTATSRPGPAPPRSRRPRRSSTRRQTIRALCGTRRRSAAKSEGAGHPESRRYRVAAEAACVIVHKASPRKRPRRRHRHPDKRGRTFGFSVAAVRGRRGDDVHVHVPVGDVAEGNDLSSRVRLGDHGRRPGCEPDPLRGGYRDVCRTSSPSQPDRRPASRRSLIPNGPTSSPRLSSPHHLSRRRTAM
jgi:hypothetical protein